METSNFVETSRAGWCLDRYSQLFAFFCRYFCQKPSSRGAESFMDLFDRYPQSFFKLKKMAFVLPSHLQLQILVQSYFSITFSGSQHCTANLKAALLLTWLMTAGYNSASIDILDPRKLSWDSYPQPSLTAVCQSHAIV